MIYFIRNLESGLIKIGTTNNLHLRLAKLKSQYKRLEVLGLMDGSYRKESALHKRFAECNHDQGNEREWFKPTPELLGFIGSETHLKIPKRPAGLFGTPLKKATNRIVNILAGDIQLKTGVRVTADAALFQFLEDHYDDLPEEARRVIDEERKGS